MNRHALSVLVENTPGVLVGVAGLFSRRNFNIDSLTVVPTEDPAVSRMTIVVAVAEGSVEEVIGRLDQVPEVMDIAELEDVASVSGHVQALNEGGLRPVRALAAAAF